MKVSIGRYSKRGRDRKVKVVIDSHDLLSLDNTLAIVIHAALVEFAKNPIGYPGNLRSLVSWEKILADMIFAFEKLKDSVFFEIETEKKVEQGLRLFAKYYRHLWY